MTQSEDTDKTQAVLCCLFEAEQCASWSLITGKFGREEEFPVENYSAKWARSDLAVSLRSKVTVKWQTVGIRGF
ncbi:hypothetical protein N7457_006540 [Penicillium paradoxum]|uniref:uncharacterized protein n=1 Tax=Penicillium paradoxum TaxID=176176 RepID=UPI0025477A61|nr:uncharacterized protein N7457_006540 [Penicillium paradoxum]KAJ5778820.1 hypothetical protein N7457_006540 [Penicillium paradoxum]